MDLVLKNEIKTSTSSYIPLVIVLGFILLVSMAISQSDLSIGIPMWQTSIQHFMAAFFIVFASFKIFDLKRFAQGYSMYDLLAKRVYAYGYVYPFIELFFGISMIYNPSKPILIAEFLVMTFSGLGVVIKLAKKEKFQCVCLGTFLKVPLTKVTLIEDFGMAILALLMLL